MAARSAADGWVLALVARLAERLGGPQSGSSAQALLRLAPRLAECECACEGEYEPERARLARRMLQAGETFDTALRMGGPWGGVADPLAVPAGVALLAALRAAAEAENPAHALAGLQTELRALGLIASRAGARQALDGIGAVGLASFGPGPLAMIRLNAALQDRETPP
jgi:hypothetical protein